MPDGSLPPQPLPPLPPQARPLPSAAQAPAVPAASPFPEAVPPSPRARRGTGVVVAIVLASAALALSVLIGLVSAGTLAYLYFAPSDQVGWTEFEDPMVFAQGTVETADGNPVDGVGTYERPARLGEHTLSWPTAAGGVLDVTVTEVDWEADALLAEVAPDNPAPTPGMVFVQATVQLEYIGPGFFVPASDLWLSLETSSWVSFPDELHVLSAGPIWDAGSLTDGEEAEVTVVLEMTEGERSSALLSVETADGEPLYLAER